MTERIHTMSRFAHFTTLNIYKNAILPINLQTERHNDKKQTMKSVELSLDLHSNILWWAFIRTMV